MTETGDAARRFHRLTSYEPGREWTTPVDDPLVRQDFTPNDPDRLTPAVKRYPDTTAALALPRELSTVDVPATAVLAGTAAVPAGHLDRAALARLLHLSAGVVRVGDRNGRPVLFRAAGSAGNRYPLELYVAAHGVSDLADAVYWYDPVEHALLPVGPAPRGDTTTIVITGVPWRTGWRYSERGYRHLYWDAGTTVAQLHALATSAGLGPALRTEFPDAEVTALVGADGTHEFPLALLSLGTGTPAITPTGPAIRGTIDAEPLEFPLVTLTQRAGDGDTLGAAWPDGAPLTGPVPDAVTLDEVIRRRGSTRRLAHGAALPRATLEFALAAARRGVSDHRPDPQYVAAHAVDGVAPGLYRWPDLDTPVRAGDLRAEIERICLDQRLGGDASFVVLSTVDLAPLTDRSYRDAQLAGGIVEGRLHLAAFALGGGASGMTFLDSELPDLLGRDLGGIIFTCVGVPEYRNRRGGTPGAPARVTPVAARLTGE